MRLLLDENLSPRVLKLLQDLDATISHVRFEKLQGQSDDLIWSVARRDKWIVVTRDADFIEMANRLGSPPKIIAIKISRPTAKDIAQAIRDNFAMIKLYAESANDFVLVIHAP